MQLNNNLFSRAGGGLFCLRSGCRWRFLLPAPPNIFLLGSKGRGVTVHDDELFHA
jgi:hypothetical protein